MEKEILCRLEDLPESGSLRLSFAQDTHGHGLCVVRRNGQTFAYLNRCPHMQSALDWQEGQFLSSDGEHIICAMHGARFEVETGECILGPCRGDKLLAVELVEENAQLVLKGPAV